MLKNKKFWAYEPCQDSQLKQELFENYKVKGRFYDDAMFFYDQMGIAPHPSLRMPANREVVDINSLSVINSMIDINSLKILVHLLPFTKIVALKFCDNNFEIDNLDFLINSLITKQNNVFFVSFEWNDKLMIHGKPVSRLEMDEESKELFNRENELFKKLFIKTKFEAVCLRANFLGDDTVIEIFNILSHPENNTQVKVLSLYKNNLTSKCIDAFCEMLLKNKKLEEVNLGCNSLTDEDVEKIKNHLGRYPLTAEEAEAHSKKIKERDLIIAKNVKLKLSKKPEMEVPYVDEMIQVEDKFFIIRNDRLRALNLMMNSITSNCFDAVKEMLEFNEGLVITVGEKVFTQEQKNILLDRTGKLYNKIVFAKS